MNIFDKIALSGLIMCVMVVIVAINFYPITKDAAIDAIVGEASNQSYMTMVCVGQAIRHRGNLHGVYGVHARHNREESQNTWLLAQDAWDDSRLIRDQIHGAKNWGTGSDLNKLNIDSTQIKAICGDIYFY